MKLFNRYVCLFIIIFFSLQINHNTFPQAASSMQAASEKIQNSQVVFTSSDLPVIIINTGGRQIVDAEKIVADMGIIYNGTGKRNNVTDSLNDFQGQIAIEYRGSTSQDFPKKPYGFETRNADGSNRDVSLLGMPADNDWVLFPPYNDKSLMRDALVYSLANKMGRYATRTRYCELVLNGEYQGIYILMEKIKRGKGRVNIAKLEPGEITGIDLTGGYILKLDKLTGDDNGGWFSSYPPYTGNQPHLFLQYHYPKPSEIVPEQKKYIQDFILQFEKTLYGSGYSDPLNGYVKYINTGSFVDYMLLTEICKNVDGYRLSTYLYKDSDSKDGRLAMGPAWDYNLAFGNSNYDKGQYTYGWQIDWPNDVYNNNIPFWWRRLLMDKNFANQAHNRWSELRKGIFSYNSISAQIDSFAVVVNESKDRNFKRWPVLGQWIWPNNFVGTTYISEVDYMKSWIKNRLAWMDANMFGVPTTADVQTENNSEALSFRLEQNYPNPFNPETTISYCLNADANVELRIFNTLGQSVKTLVSGPQQAGRNSVNWNSCNDLGQVVPSGIYIYRIETGGFVKSGKMLLLK